MLTKFQSFNFLYYCWEWVISIVKSDSIKLIVTTAIEGVISYFYVLYRENKKEKIETKNRCAKALLNTQMTIMLQMNEAYSFYEFCWSILNKTVLLGKMLQIWHKNY
jgi:hypothetical protein